MAERKKTPPEIKEAYKKIDNETKAEKTKRLDAKRRAKRRYYEREENQEDELPAGPSTRTRSQTEANLPVSTRTRTKKKESKETDKLRQQRNRAKKTTT